MNLSSVSSLSDVLRLVLSGGHILGLVLHLSLVLGLGHVLSLVLDLGLVLSLVSGLILGSVQSGWDILGLNNGGVHGNLG